MRKESCVKSNILSVYFLGLLGTSDAASYIASNATVNGSASCPCLYVNHSKAERVGIYASGTYAFDSDYGSAKCETWDMNVHPTCTNTSSKPAYCKEKWCYIDPDICHDSKFSYYESVAIPGSDLFYSYATCGADGTDWDTDSVSASLSGMTLTVAIPTTEYPDQFIYDDDGEVVSGRHVNESELSRLTGSVIDLFEVIAENAGFTIEYTTVSSGSYYEHPESSYTACVADVSKGLLDLCVGRFWTTKTRLTMTSFSAPLEIDIYKMLVPRPATSESLVAYFVHPFAPFDQNLWCAIVATILMVGLVRAKLQVNEAHFRENAKIYSMYGAIKHEVYETMMEFLTMAPEKHLSSDIAPRILSVGFAIFALLIVSAYTANLAATLTTEILDTDGITSLSRCADKGCTLCVQPAVYSDVTDVYGDYTIDFYSAGDGTIATFGDAILDGKCDSALLEKHSTDVLYNIDEYQDVPCDHYYLSETLMWIPTAFPVRTEYARTISYWTRKFVEDGTMDEIFEEYLPSIPAVCDPFVDSQAAGSASTQITIRDMATPLALVGFLCILALLIDYRKNGTRTFINQCKLRFGMESYSKTKAIKLPKRGSEKPFEAIVLDHIKDGEERIMRRLKTIELRINGSTEKYSQVDEEEQCL